jgi:hypothetical protein
VDPAAPPITIVNPNAPLGTADLLDNGRDPWRASPRQKVAVLLTAVIVAVVSGAVAEIRHVHHEQALDAAAMRDVAFATDPSLADGGFDNIVVTLVNEGQLPVHVLGVTLVGDGYQERTVDVELASYANAAVPLSSAKNCRVSMMSTDPQQVRVRVRTGRGDVVTRTVPLPTELTRQVGYAERNRCGYLRPGDALINEVVSTKARGRDVVVTMKLYNQSVFPLTITKLDAFPGLSASMRLPVTVPRRTFWTRNSPPQIITVTLRVADCIAFSEGFGREGMQVHLRNPYVSGETYLSLIDSSHLYEPDQPLRPGTAQGILAKTCPWNLFPQPAFDDPTFGFQPSSPVIIPSG